jgi:hypothetical protein
MVALLLLIRSASLKRSFTGSFSRASILVVNVDWHEDLWVETEFVLLVMCSLNLAWNALVVLPM